MEIETETETTTPILEDSGKCKGKLSSSYCTMIVSFIKGIVIFMFQSCGIYIFWICVHYISAHLYTEMCVPRTYTGFILSPLMAQTPQCRAIRWMLLSASSVIDNMWLVFGTWLVSNLIIPKI